MDNNEIGQHQRFDEEIRRQELGVEFSTGRSTALEEVTGGGSKERQDQLVEHIDGRVLFQRD